MKKNKKIIIMLVLLLGLICLTSVNLEKKETKSISLSSKEYKESSESEYNFYNCAINAYNKENDTELTELTDEQLASIKTLECNYISATEEPITGGDILKKMISLENLAVSNVSGLDLSNNKKLKILGIFFSNFEDELDLGNNVELEGLGITFSQLKNLNLSNNTKLKQLELSMVPISEVNINENNSLEELYLMYTQLSTINLQNNVNLKALNLEGNQLTSIDLSKNIKLEKLYLSSNQLSSIDLTKNTLLNDLYVDSNLLKNIDLSKNVNLVEIDISHNQIENIDLSNNNLLEDVSLYKNKLKEINVTNLVKLKGLDINSNLLENLDLRKNTVLNYLDASNNTLKNIYMFDNYSINEYDFYPQYANQTLMDFGNSRAIEPSEDLEFYVGDRVIIRTTEKMDVSDFIEKLGVKNLSVSIIRDSYGVTSGNIESGDIISIYEGNEIVIEMEIHIVANDLFNDSVFYNCVVDAYNQKNRENLPYNTILTDEQLQSINSLTCNDTNISDTKGLEGLISLKYLNLSNSKLESIDLSKNDKLTYLNLNDNYLYSIDLSNNTELENLDLSDNNLSSIDLSNNTQLQKLDLSDNVLENANFEKNTLLNHLILSDNELEKADFNNNTMLLKLKIDSNYIETVDLSKNSTLEILDISDNKIEAIDLSKNTALKYLNLGENKIKTVDLSKNISLEDLNISNNEIKTIDLSKNIALHSFASENNHLIALNLKNNTELRDLYLYSDNLTTIDLSQNNNLINVMFYVNPGDVMLYKGSTRVLPKIEVVLPEHMEVEEYGCFPGEHEIISFDNENMSVVGNGIGKTNVEKYYINPSNVEYSLYYVVNYDIDVINLTSNKYIINEENNYIYTVNDIVDEKIIENLKVNFSEDAELYVESNKLKLKYKDNLIRQFDVINIDFGQLDIKNGIISYSENMTYESLIDNITANGVTYKVYKGEEVITSGSISNGTLIKVYKDEKIIDQFIITDEDLEFDESLNIDNNVIFKLKEGITVADILSKVNTSGEIKIKNNTGSIIDGGDIISTGYKIEIELSSGTTEYTLVVSGDVTGDGIVNIADVLKIADHTISKDKLTDYELYAAEVTNDTNLNIADVIKIADYTLDKRIEIWR